MFFVDPLLLHIFPFFLLPQSPASRPKREMRLLFSEPNNRTHLARQNSPLFQSKKALPSLLCRGRGAIKNFLFPPAAVMKSKCTDRNCVSHTHFFGRKCMAAYFSAHLSRLFYQIKVFPPPFKNRGVFRLQPSVPNIAAGKQGDFPTWLDYHLARSELHHTCLATKKSRSMGAKKDQ